MPPKSTNQDPARRSARVQAASQPEATYDNGPEHIRSNPESDNPESDDSQDNNNQELRDQIKSLQEQILQLKAAALDNRPLRSTELDLDPPQRISQTVSAAPRFVSETPTASSQTAFWKRMPKIEPLSDGTSPTFRQWQASIRDRLEFSQDQYPSERARMAEVWGHTEGLAKEYLEPQYLSESPQERFRSANEMIDLLKTYFVSGNEQAEYRTAFHKLQMDRSETFPAFKARFLSAAIKGRVNKEEWFFYLWEKITPSLRVPNLVVKATWHNSFEKMVFYLTAFDMERRNAPATTSASTRSVQLPQPRVKPSSDQRRITSGVTMQPQIAIPRQSIPV